MSWYAKPEHFHKASVEDKGQGLVQRLTLGHLGVFCTGKHRKSGCPDWNFGHPDLRHCLHHWFAD